MKQKLALNRKQQQQNTLIPKAEGGQSRVQYQLGV